MDRVGSNSEKQFNNGLMSMFLEAEKQVCNTVLRGEPSGFRAAETHFPLPIFPSSIQLFWVQWRSEKSGKGDKKGDEIVVRNEWISDVAKIEGKTTRSISFLESASACLKRLSIWVL